MPPPPSYLDIAAVPYSRVITQAEFNGGTFGGVANEVWFRYALGAPIVLGEYCNTGGTFKGDARIYAADGTTLIAQNTSATNVAKSFYLSISQTYYIKITRHGGGASNFDFTAQFDTRPVDGGVVIQTGDVIVNDDDIFPAVVLAPDGTVRGYLTTIPTGEAGAQLASGETLWHDPFGVIGPSFGFVLLDAAYQLITTVDLSFASSSIPAMSASTTDFYIVDTNTPGSGDVWAVTVAGVGTMLGTLPAIPSSAGVNPGGTILYWTEASGSAAIHRWDVSMATPVSDLATITGYDTGADNLGLTVNGLTGDLLVLDDGTVIVVFNDVSAASWVIVIYNAAGTELFRYTYIAATAAIDRMTTIPGDSDHILVWFYVGGNDVAQFGRLTIATGVIDNDFNKNMFALGESLVANDAEMFGPSSCCDILSVGVTSVSPGSPEGTGIIGPLVWVHWPRVLP